MLQGQATLLSARVSGIIVKSNVQENEKVKVGQVLAELKPDDYQNALDQSESDMESLQAQLKAAQSGYERTARLFKTGASTQEKMDNMEAQFHSLLRKLKSAQAQVA